MAYSAPPQVTPGEYVDEIDWNRLVDDITFLANPPACRVYHNTTQAVGDNVSALVLFNSERYDTDSMHSTSVNTGRITFNTAGIYIVTFNCLFAAGADYATVYGEIRLNGVTPLVWHTNQANAVSQTPSINLVTAYKFAAADYIEARVVQDNTASASRNIINSGNSSPEFAATWVGLG